MLDGLFMLLTLSTIMAVASFLAGSLPLTFALSQARLRLVATIGMGVLVGTALIVIIPEGVETLYTANDAHTDVHLRRHIVAPIHNAIDGLTVPLNKRTKDFKVEEEQAISNAINAPPGPVIPSDASGGLAQVESVGNPPPRTPTGAGVVGALKTDEHTKSSEPHAHETSHTEHEPHAWIGLSLVLGFILMYLLDTLPLLAPSAPSHTHNNIYSLSDLSSSPAPNAPAAPQRSLSTTLGLCIHAAADGIALGASSASSATASLSLIIFVAIMVHKAPAAFGLTSVLLKQGLGKKMARAHLIIFSLAAPAGALCTWVLVRALGGGGQGEPALMKWWTGVLLLFSGGTFLYVAMHTMQEDDQNGATDETQGNGYAESSTGRSGRRQKEGKSPRLVFAAVGGMLLPLLTQIGHAH